MADKKIIRKAQRGNEKAFLTLIEEESISFIEWHFYM